MSPLGLNQDFLDILAALNASGADYLVVGAYAMAAHGHVRATGDIDILVNPNADNAKRVLEALHAFGAPVEAHGVKAKDFVEPGTVYQIGLPPRRIDLLSSITGIDYESAARHPLEGKLGDCSVRFIGKADLIKNKRATGRLKDAADAEALEQVDDDTLEPPGAPGS